MICGRYRIEQRIGEGGAGVVYKGYDTNEGRVVAIKQLKNNENLDQNSKNTKRFELEAQAMIKLDHPNIVKIYDLELENDVPKYIIMEYVEGQMLSSFIRENNIHLNVAKEIFIQSLKGLRSIHKAILIHRDIKPDNIMITKDSVIKIMDFGIVKNLEIDSGLTMASSIIGTPKYLAPEVVNGKAVSHKSDMYSLGLCFYYVLGGNDLFDAESVSGVLANVMEGRIPPLNEVNLDIPKKMQDIIENMYAKTPDARFNDLEKIISELMEVKVEGEDNALNEIGSLTVIDDEIFEDEKSQTIVIKTLKVQLKNANNERTDAVSEFKLLNHKYSNLKRELNF